MISVRTGCRIHFGLIELAPNQAYRFGGLGLMLDAPETHVEINDVSQEAQSDVAAPEDSAECQARVQAVIARCSQWISDESHCDRPEVEEILQRSVRVHQTIPSHHGLGSGTQLCCAVASAIWHAYRMPGWQQHALNLAPIQSQDATELNERILTALSGRGLRSAIGVSGFLHGGLILDYGRTDVDCEDQIARSGRIVTTKQGRFPSAWRVLLLRPQKFDDCIHGKTEKNLLAQAARKPNPHAHTMLDLADQILQLTSESTGDFLKVTHRLDEYMTLASKLFESQQGGQFNGPALTQLAETARAAGLAAVGQSSWGPTIFGLCESEDQAIALRKRIIQSLSDRNNVRVEIRKPLAEGVRIERSEP